MPQPINEPSNGPISVVAPHVRRGVLWRRTKHALSLEVAPQKKTGFVKHCANRSIWFFETVDYLNFSTIACKIKGSLSGSITWKFVIFLTRQFNFVPHGFYVNMHHSCGHA